MRRRPKLDHVLLHAASYHALEAALWRELDSVRSREPLAPIIVVVPTNLLRRHLAAEGAVRAPAGIINVHFLTLLDLARELGEPALAATGRALLPNRAEELVARAACRAVSSSYFAAIAHRPGFQRALLGAIADLKEAGHTVADLERCLAAPRLAGDAALPKLRDLAALWQAYERRLGDLALRDSADLLAAAAAAGPRDGWLARAAAVFVYGFYDLNALQRRLVAGATVGRPARAFFPYDPAAAAFRYAKATFEWFVAQGFAARAEAEAEASGGAGALARRLFEQGVESPKSKVQSPKSKVGSQKSRAESEESGGEGRGGEGDSTSRSGIATGAAWMRIVSAPDETREVGAIVRAALGAERSGLPLPRVGVLLRQASVYAPLFAEECAAGGLDAYHHDPPSLATTRAGRSLLMLLRLLGSDVARAEVMDFLTYADLPVAGTTATADWDLLSIEAGIVKGRESWRGRLAALRLALAEPRDDEDEPGRAAELLSALDGLEAFLGGLFPALDAVPDRGTWAELSGAVLALFRQFVRPGEEREAVAEAVGELAELDVTGEPADLPTLARLTQEVLESRRPQRPPFGSRGPVVVDLLEGRGLTFDLVCVPGLVEKGFPAPPSPDPLLSDRERAELNKAGLRLPLKSRRAEEERLLFRLAVGAGSEGVLLSYPRLEVASGRERVPSHFLLRAVEAVTGRRCNYAGLEKFAGHERIGASALAPAEPGAAWREGEYDLSVALAALKARKGAELSYLGSVSPTFSAALRAERSRWGEKGFTPYDGALAAEAALEALRERLGPPPWRMRPTAMEEYAACPFRYFVRHVLGAAPVEEPEAVRRLSGLDRGTIIHRILHRFLKQARDRGELPVVEGSQEKILALAREELEEFRKRGLVGLPPLWDMERAAIEADLRRFVLDEADDKSGYTPAHFEVCFGAPRREGELRSEKGLVLDLGEVGKVEIVGRIDRIDLTADGRRGRVVDYKTGKEVKLSASDPLAGGTALQLPLYLNAAEELLAGPAMEAALYRHVTQRGGYSDAVLSRDVYDSIRDRLLAIMATIAEGIRHGRFFAGVPHNADCSRCDYRCVCGAAAWAAARRKQGDAAASAYFGMREAE